MGAGQSDVDQSDDAGTGQGEQDAVGDDAAQTEAPKNGLGVGETPVQAEGLWLFVPSLAAEGSAARVSVNGWTTQSVGSGETVKVSSGDTSCNVTVAGIGSGMVGLVGSFA